MLLKLNFRCHSPKKHVFWEIGYLHFSENISFAGLKSKFLNTQQKFYMSYTQPINMSSIGPKLMKIEPIKKPRFFPVTVDQRDVAHFESWTYDQRIDLWSRKSSSRVNFLKITFWKVCHASEYSVILHYFSQNFWLCKPVEDFYASYTYVMSS